MPRDADGVYGLSHGQAALWYLQRFVPDTAAYNLSVTLRVRPALDVARMHEALDAVVAAHPTLRVVFDSMDGRPVQRVLDDRRIGIVEHDASGLGDDALRAEVTRAAADAYDLATGPLVRLHVWHLGDEDVLLLGAHHTAADFRSVEQVITQILDAYARVPVEAPDETYRDFVEWQERFVAGEEGLRQERFWTERLGTAPPVLQLPTDHPRPPLQSLRGDRVPFRLDADTSAAVKALARSERSSTMRVLLATYVVLLHRYTEQEELLVGMPVGGRVDERFASVVGHFVNVLPVRTVLSGRPTFRAVLQQVDQAVRETAANQDYPFPLIVDRLRPARDASRSPLFQTVFNSIRSGIPEMAGLVTTVPGCRGFERDGMRFEQFPVPQQNGQFDIVVWTMTADEHIVGEFKYATDLFDRPTIERMTGHYRTLLEAFVADPDASVTDVGMLTPAEREQLIVTFNRTDHPYRDTLCMHQPFEEQADAAPERTAVLCGGDAMTYGELEAASNRTANLLRSLAPDREGTGLVGVFLDRTIDIPVALFGILKSGSAYVPLATDHPKARLELILSSLPIATIVTQRRHVPALQELDVPGLKHLVVLDDRTAGDDGPRAVLTADDVGAQPSSRPPPTSDATDTAYIIFTSGSTGTPKGVEVCHRPAMNVIGWVNETFGVGPADRLLMVTSLSFDLSVYDIFGVLGAGGSVHIATDDELRDPARLVRLLVDEPITFWDSAPPALQRLVPFLPPSASSPLRLVLLSGDWIGLALPDQIRSVWPDAEVVSLGGATEATIWSNVYRIGAIDPGWASIPYGKPIWNARYYVLDPHRNPCPIGVPGDLFIGGECLAAGYVNDPTLTASKFVPDPFNTEPGARMYRTGDRARFFPDGNIEFLGRKDFQVKIRGYRIELGEIESAIHRHPSVADCTVIARDDVGSDRTLVAYVVPAEGTEPSAADLREHLRDQLPHYMVPTFVEFLDRMPLTSNGKLDRRGLPPPAMVRDVGTDYVPPRTDLERAIVAIWERVLGLDRVGIEDDFFELGGHSLGSVEIVQEVGELVGRQLPLSMMLQAPTVAALAAAAERDEAPTPLVTLRAATGAPIVLFHPAGGDVVPYRELVELLGEEQPVLGVRSRVVTGAEEHGSIDAMADAYAEALASAGGPSPQVLCGWSMGGVIAHAVAHRLEAAGDPPTVVAIIDSPLQADGAAVTRTLAYRVGTAFGPLAPLAAALPPDDVAGIVDELLGMPAADRIRTAAAFLADHGVDAARAVDERVLEQQARAIGTHEELLRRHRAPTVSADLRVWWARGTLLDGEPPTDWPARTTGTAQVTIVEGNHYTVLAPPTVGEIATEIRRLSAALRI